MRHVLTAGVSALMVSLAASPALAASERAPFTDYRQAPTDMYGQAVSGVQSSGATSPATGSTTSSGSSSVGGSDITAVNATEPVPVQAGTTRSFPVVGAGAGRSLPFTGLDLLLVVLVGAAGISAGLMLRAATRLRRGSRLDAAAR